MYDTTHPRPQPESYPQRGHATRTLSMVIVLAALFLASTSFMMRALAAQSNMTTNNIYQYAGECVTLYDNRSNTYLTQDNIGYVMTPFVTQAIPLRMQATGLGSYLLFGPDAKMPAAWHFNFVVPEVRMGPQADWILSDGGAALELRNVSTGQNLSVSWFGRLTQNQLPNVRWNFEPAEGCATFPELKVNVESSQFAYPGHNTEVKGFVDAHVHITAYEFLGGRFHCGRPWSPYGVKHALKDCPDHGINGRLAIAENLLSTGSLTGSHSSKGWPDFDGWPRQDSLTHEGTYWKGIERNWRAGLRIMVADLVENRALCEIYWLKKNPCTDMESIRLQAQGLYDLQDYIDAQFKGPGKGFFRIVKTPAEARAVINDGKLAVIIGVETSQPFDCLYKDGIEICTREQIDKGLKEWWDLGVRSMFPVHKFDNAFGGTTMDEGTEGILVNLGNLYMTGRWWEVGACTGDEQDRTPISPVSDVSDLRVRMAESELDDLVFSEEFIAPLEDVNLPWYPPGPVCNVRGLTDLGVYLINRMIEMGMIIETDHLSARARDTVLQIVEAENYSGVVTSHSWGGAASRARIQALGGFVALRANSTTNFIAEWQQARPAQPGGFLWGIGYGSDTNGIAVQAAPRDGAVDDNPVTYPFVSFDGNATIHQSQWADKLWDFNLDGAAHYGLYADWVEDLQHVAGQDIVNNLARGAETYLQMWQRVTERSISNYRGAPQ